MTQVIATPLPSHDEDTKIRAYANMVKIIAIKVAAGLPREIEFEDLYSAGLVGLAKALRLFENDRGVQFKTYASILIRGAMFDQLRDRDWVPRLIRRKLRKIREVVQKLEMRGYCPPTDRQIAVGLNISLAVYRRWVRETAPQRFVSLDVMMPDDVGPTAHADHHEEIEDPGQEIPWEAAARNERAAIALKSISDLRDPQKTVLWLYYVADMRQIDIGRLFGTTDCRISQIRTEGLAKLRGNPDLHLSADL